MARRAQHIAVEDLPRESLLGGTWRRTAVRGDHSLVTYNWMDPAMPRQPLHSHDFDQVSMIVSGTMEFVVDDTRYLVGPGEALHIPANAPHTGVAVGTEIALNIDVYAPPRPDYLHLTAYQGGGWPDTGTSEPGPPDTGTSVPGPPDADDRAAVHDLLAEWAHRLDTGRPHDAAGLLTDDALVVGLGPDRHGPDGFREWADARAARADRRTHHQLGNHRHLVHGDGTITGTTYVVLHVVDAARPEPVLEFVGHYDDLIVRTPDGLRFARRTVTALGR